MNITDEMVKAFVDNYDEGCCNDSSADWCCARHALARVAPLIAAQALRSAGYEYAAKVTFRDGTTLIDTARTTSLPMAHHRAATIRAEFPPKEIPEPEDVATAVVIRRTIGPWEDAGAEGDCCARPNMVWEHSRGSKDHFRCVGCGGGMTKPRAVAP
jgi:hypothetical protein